MQHKSHVLVIGSGLGGCLFALKAAQHGSVTLLTKRSRDEGSSKLAQGGIAAAWADDDSWRDHVQDTLVAGAGLCRREVVDAVVRDARERVEELIALGVEFTRHEGGDEYSLHREGGHSTHRVLHAKDATGAEIMRALLQKVAEHDNIRVLEDVMAIDLITAGWLARRTQQVPPHPDRVLGCYALDLQTSEVHTFSAKVVAVCTGGTGKVYLYTSNPDVASGDGIAMAYRAGARVGNMEFVQFHPTCLFHPDARNFLISEALRGDGGRLRLRNGEAFMARYDERLELAPRDIVARAIDSELKRRGDECVFLDMSHRSRDELVERFPMIYEKCMSLGIDIATQPIPVVPAAHYQCGGIMTDLNGESDIENLFAIGESACTGLHGANRLASNSLLEATWFAHAAAAECAGRLGDIPDPAALPDWDPGGASQPDEQVVITQTWDEIRRFMWNYVGIVRTTRRLERARKRVHLLQDEIRDYYWDFDVTGDLVELRDLATTAELVVTCALLRRESRGLHFTLDHPKSDARFVGDTVVKRRF